jgi:hypothetical protein
MERALVTLVWQRARSTCEYCQLAQRFSTMTFEIDHVIAEKHGGPTHEANLALTCFLCNRYKGPNIAGIVPGSGRVTRLYHPRKDVWAKHFRWDGPRLLGRTPVANATITVLQINHPDAAAVRTALIEEGVFPPGTR